MKEDFRMQSVMDDCAKQMGFECYNLCRNSGKISMTAKKLIVEIDEIFARVFTARRNGDAYHENVFSDKLNEKLTELGYECYNLGVSNRLPSPAMAEDFKKMQSIVKGVFSNKSPETEPEPLLEEPEIQPDDFREEPLWDDIPQDGIQCVCGYINNKEWNYCKNCGTKLK
ncbi:MAG: hypothetical protein ACI4EA_09540 [Candidatus Ornithomonoglobus sp.]